MVSSSIKGLSFKTGCRLSPFVKAACCSFTLPSQNKRHPISRSPSVKATSKAQLVLKRLVPRRNRSAKAVEFPSKTGVDARVFTRLHAQVVLVSFNILL